jgi:hypothetical protein
MSTGERIDPVDDPRRQMHETVAKASMSPAVRKRKLILWAVRLVLLCGLAWYFWEGPWMPWAFGAGVFLSFINLTILLLMPRFLAAKEKRTHASIGRTSDAIEQERRARDSGPR